MTDIVACLEAGSLRPRIAHRFPLTEIAAAHEMLYSSRAPGRIVLDIV